MDVRGYQHVPLEEYTENLQKLVDLIKEYGATNIVLLTPPPVSESGRIKHNTAVSSTT